MHIRGSGRDLWLLNAFCLSFEFTGIEDDELAAKVAGKDTAISAGNSAWKKLEDDACVVGSLTMTALHHWWVSLPFFLSDGVSLLHWFVNSSHAFSPTPIGLR